MSIYFVGLILDELYLRWGEEETNGSFMDTWLDSPYIYDIHDTNDGDSMTVMTQVRSDILTCQA